MHDLSSVIFEDGVDVLLLQEPWVNDDRVCGLPGAMRVYECEGGMAAVVVANGSMEAMLVSKSEWGVCVWVRGEFGSMYVASVYMRLRQPVEAALQYMDGCLDIGREGKVIIGMDANACSGMWYSKPSRRTRDNEERASKIEEWISANGVRVLNQPSEVYSFCAQGMSDIDVTVCKGMDEWRMEWMVRDDRGTSDHNPIYIDAGLVRVEDIRGRRGGRHWTLCASKNAHMAASLRSLADSTGYGTFFGLGVNEKVEMIDGWMREVCDEHLSGGRKRNDRLKWWTNELEKMKRGVRRRRKEWQREKRRGGEGVNEMRIRYRQGINEYKKAMAECKRNDWQEYVRVEGNKNPWGGVDKIVRGKMRRMGVASIRVEGGYTRTWKESAERLLERFFPRDEQGDDWRVSVEGTDEENEPVMEFEESETERVVRRVKRKKAPGLDGFRNEWIRIAWSVIPEYVSGLMSDCLREGCFPIEWKQARVVALLKSVDKDPAQPGSYRPVSLLCGWGKMLEGMLTEAEQLLVCRATAISVRLSRSRFLSPWVSAGSASTLQRKLPGGARITWWNDRLQSLKVSPWSNAAFLPGIKAR
ncbi:unnamed protein product [Trichogramma brassicae]|uniref:Endonuclease/exonuclease/phosphatase domain-containing protein n=1 Tax=Trichogramma brassicae TaxID=86971 RepID=A0A6H5IG00_9HYME|nr:unnamed protein product [Trichogramma brassicae]